MEFIINDKRLLLTLSNYKFEAVTVEATAFSDSYRGYLPGHRFISLEGITQHEETIKGKYLCIDVLPDGTPILRTAMYESEF